MKAMSEALKPSRIHWMDNLRTVTIFLVVLYHVGGVYESAGLWGWFWIVDDPTTMVWVGIMGIAFDIFVMPLMFLVSGYLAPASLSDRSLGAFVLAKARRLIVPWLLAVLTLIPLYRVIFLYSRGLPQESWTSCFHWVNPNSQNWLWFLPLLFVFSVLYALLARSGVKWPRLKPRTAIVLALPVVFAWSWFIGGIAGFRSWTLTPFIDFENERLLLYFLSFLLGVLFHHQRVFDEEPRGKVLYSVVNGIAWIPVTAHIFVRLVPFFVEGFIATPMYRAAWWLTFDLALLCMTFVMVETFRRYFDRTGPVWRALNDSSYGVYIIHVIMIGVFGTLLMNTGLPVYVKYPALILLAWGGSNVLVMAYKGVRSGALASSFFSENENCQREKNAT